MTSVFRGVRGRGDAFGGISEVDGVYLFFVQDRPGTGLISTRDLRRHYLAGVEPNSWNEPQTIPKKAVLVSNIASATHSIGISTSALKQMK